MTIIDTETYLRLVGRMDESGEEICGGLDLGVIESLTLELIDAQVWEIDDRFEKWKSTFKDERSKFEDQAVYVGSGSSRLAFLLKNGRCLKLAWNRKGLAQNKQEAKTMKGLDSRKYSFLPSFYGAAESGAWIVEDFYGAMTDEVWEKLFTQPIFTVMWIVQEMVRIEPAEGEDEESYGKRFMKEYKFRPLTAFPPTRVASEIYGMIAGGKGPWKALHDLVAWYRDNPGNKDEMLISDLYTEKNWGFKEENGTYRVVVVDAGFSEKVCNDWYVGR